MDVLTRILHGLFYFHLTKVLELPPAHKLFECNGLVAKIFPGKGIKVVGPPRGIEEIGCDHGIARDAPKSYASPF